jgi:hypothetical protein
MKPSLAVLAGIAIVVGGAFAFSRASAVPAFSAAHSGALCRMAQLPPATATGSVALYGHIKSLRRKGGRFELRFDPALLLTGATASRAALEDTGSADVPNDSYTADESHRAYTFLVPATARVTHLTNSTCSTRTTVAKLAKAVSPAGFWLRVRGDTVRSLDQQYQP